MYYDKQGKPIGLFEHAKLFRPDYKRVKQTTLPNKKWVSTVWLGINHRFGKGEPLIFETMVFPSKSNLKELDMDRYSTEAEAIAGHKKMCRKWRKRK